MKVAPRAATAQRKFLELPHISKTFKTWGPSQWAGGSSWWSCWQKEEGCCGSSCYHQPQRRGFCSLHSTGSSHLWHCLWRQTMWQAAFLLWWRFQNISELIKALLAHKANLKTPIVWGVQRWRNDELGWNLYQYRAQSEDYSGINIEAFSLYIISWEW